MNGVEGSEGSGHAVGEGRREGGEVQQRVAGLRNKDAEIFVEQSGNVERLGSVRLQQQTHTHTHTHTHTCTHTHTHVHTHTHAHTCTHTHVRIC